MPEDVHTPNGEAADQPALPTLDEIKLGNSPVIQLSRESIIDAENVEDIILNEINVAAQMRAEFPEGAIADLAHSIRSTKLLHPLYICRMDEMTARRYVEYTNQLWGRSIDFGTFVPVGGTNGQEYDILIMGERRLRALNTIEEYVQGQKHAQAFRLRAVSPDGFAYLTATQVAENLHERPDTYQFAVAAYTLYKTGQYDSVRKFVEDIGGAVGESQAYNAVSFFRLPEEVRIDVEHGSLSYSAAVELSRHQNNVFQMLSKHLIDQFIKERNLQGVEEIAPETLSEIKEVARLAAAANAVVMGRHIVRKRMTAGSVAKNRDLWLEEMRYEQLGLSAIQVEAEVDIIHRAEAATARYLREILNDASRVSERAGFALRSLFIFFGGDERAAHVRKMVRNNVARTLRGQKGVFESVAREYSDSEPGDLARYLLDVLDRHPDPSLDEDSALNSIEW